MKIVFFGDISLHEINYQRFQFCDRLKALITAADLSAGNLECPLTTAKHGIENMAVYLKAPKESISLLKGFDVLSLANNHIRDYMSEGALDSLFTLETNGIKGFGIGLNQSEAVAPLKIEKDGFKIAFIGATRFANCNSENGYGTGRDNHPEIFSNIKKLKKEGYFVVPFFHWGYEYVRIPSPRERSIAHRCIDSGADLVIGAHPHIYQGIEEYKRKQIVYSLGNFIFHSTVFDGLSPVPNDPRLYESFAFSVDVNSDHSYESEIHGYSISDEMVKMYDNQANENLIKEVEEVSEILKASWFRYSKAYYEQAYEIAKQSIKVRKKFQNIGNKGLIDKLRIYGMANSQDIKNRIAALILSFVRK